MNLQSFLDAPATKALSIGIVPALTAFFIFLGNLGLDSIKSKNEKNKSSRVFLALIESQVENVHALQGLFASGEISIIFNIENLEKAFSRDEISALIIDRGGCFSTDILELMALYLESLKENDVLLRKIERTREKLALQVQYSDTNRLQLRIDELYKDLLDSRMELIIIRGLEVCSKVYLEVVGDRRKSGDYISFIKEERYQRLVDRLRATQNEASNPYKYLKERIENHVEVNSSLLERIRKD